MAGKLTLDRGALKNPTTAHLRIYVGNLAEGVTEEHLYDRFIEYGKINGIAINRGFSFIQFDTQESVKKAIESAHQTLFFDNKKLNVRSVQPKNGPMDAQANYQEQPPPEPPTVAEEPEDMHDNYPSYGEESQNQGTTSFESVKLLDRSAMKNPSTTHLRIYVGNLTENVTAEQLYNRFIEYGHIDGIIINRGFGFIQFYKEESAKKAIEQANRTPFQDGRMLLVSPVQSKNKGEGDGTNAYNDKPYAAADGSAAATEDTEDNQDEFGGDGQAGAYETDTSYDEGGFPKRVRVRGRRRGRGRGAAQGGGGGGAGPPTGPPPGAPPGGFRDRSPIAMGREGRFDRFERFAAPPRALPLSDRNDCEIIVVSKALTEYAEYIEGRLKRLGIVVDLLFPMEDVPIGKVLGNIASRGCLYAILVMPINQERRSLTLTILHGIPQEHRNMRVEDALSLLARNFEEVRRGGAAGREAVYALLGQLADGRALTALQYDKVIEYLKERREQQAKIELGEPLQSSAAKPAQTELQQRILKILNEKIAPTSETAPSPAAPPAPAPVPAAADPPKAKLLNDPSVRKALDSILQKYA